MTSVLLLTQHLERAGGVGVHVLRAAAALRDAGRRVEVVAGRVDPENAGEGVHEIPGLEARRVPKRTLDELARVASGLPGPVVAQLHHIWDPQVVEGMRLFGPVAWNIHEFAACPTGNYYFEPGHECHRNHGPGCWPHILLHGCAHTWDLRSMPGRYRRTAQHIRIMQASDAVIAYSRFVARHVRRNGIQDVRIAPLIVPEVPGWTAPPEEKRVLFAGRIAPNKGLQTLLAAARGVDVRIDVVGSGWWQPAAEELAGKLGVGDRVTFHGWLGAPEVEELYRRSTVVAVPSLWPEPFGMVGPEAMAQGRPVIASDTGGIPDWLDHDRTGLLVQPGDEQQLADALRRLLGDPELCRRMGEAGAERVRKHYSPAAHTAALDEIHDELTSTGSGVR